MHPRVGPFVCFANFSKMVCRSVIWDASFRCGEHDGRRTELARLLVLYTYYFKAGVVKLPRL